MNNDTHGRKNSNISYEIRKIDLFRNLLLQLKSFGYFVNNDRYRKI